MSDTSKTQPDDYYSTKHLIKREASAIVKLLMPFFAILSIVLWFHEFVFHAIKANVTINGLIITAAFYGVILIVIRMVGAQIDFYVIERFGREAMQGVYMPQLMAEPWLKRRYVRHYLGHIAKTGGTLSSALQQDAIENELSALSSEYEHKLELPQFIVGFMIAMGLLGTFIGLLETLTGISGMLDGFGGAGADMDAQFMKLVVELRKPLAGMGIAFSASMFGLVTSLMLAIMMISLRRYVSRVVACARNVMHDLTELGQAASGSAGAVVSQLTPEQIEAMAVGGGSAAGFTGGGRVARVSPATLSDGDSSLQDLVYQVNDTSLLVANHIDSLTHKIDALIHVFESSVKLSQKQNELLATVPRLSDTSDKILKEMRDLVGGQAEQQKFFQLLVDASSETLRSQNGLLGAVPALNDTGGKILKELKGLTSGQGEQQRLSQMLVDASGHMTHAQNDLLRAVPGLSETGESILSELKGLFGGSAEQQKLLQALEAAGNNSTQIVSGITGVQREVQVKLNASLANLDDRLARIEETATNFAGHMEDIKENSTHFKAYSGVAETIADGIGHQTLLLETLVKEDRNLQKRLVSIQQDLREQLLRLDPEAPEDAPPST